VAVRRGVPALTVCGTALAVTANAMSAAGRGPWRGLSDAPQVAAATQQLFIAVAVLGAWALAVTASDRERARSRSMSESAARRQVQALQTVTARLAGAATATGIAELIAREGIALVAANGVAGVVTADGAHVRTWVTPGFPAAVAARFALLPVAAPVQITDALRRGGPAVVQTPAEMAERYPDAAASYAGTGVRSALAVPALLNGVAVGVLAFGFQQEHAVDAGRIAYAESLAALFAQALDRARLYEREHEAAHQLQTALLPVLAESLPGVTAAGAYQPSEATHDVGGDWYDVFALAGGRIAFAVGDVVGHDLKAAVTMGRLQTTVRTAARTHDSPADVLGALDRAAADIAGAFCTSLGYGDYDPRARRLRYACAGHLPPLLITAAGVRFLQDGRGTPLGVKSRRGRSHATVPVPPGAMLVWYTDGLIERRAESLDIGLKRLAEAAGQARATGTAAGLRDHLIATLAGDRPLADDVAVLCLHLP
jgi:serine phosphatase RsbU (regulator of sigma subunit)